MSTGSRGQGDGQPSVPPALRPRHPAASTTGTVVIGAGQAGLALSHCLTERGHEHVLLERGRVAERWRSQRWDSLRLLTPNWMTRLPGHRYTGGDPDGFMTAAEAVGMFDSYAASFDAPVVEGVEVEQVTHDGCRFVVRTASGTWRADNVVVATGWCDLPAVPRLGRHLSARIHQIVPTSYRNPADVPEGGVLVVGASATGVQLADELHRAGHPTTIAVGSHFRMPRRYRGMDVCWWLDHIGAFDRTVDEIDDVRSARGEPSLQLAGRPDHASLDLARLQADGIRLAGRLAGVNGARVVFDSGLEATLAAADARMERLLTRIDGAITRAGLEDEVLDAEPLPRVRPVDAPRSLDLESAGITSVVWATGYRRRYPWLGLPVLDARGEIVQRRGITPFPGAYVLGQRLQHRRSSSFIDGVGRDAEYIASHIATRRKRRSELAALLLARV